jgi:hypothetical protein
MPREDLALSIKRGVVAIFAHQHMRQQSRARHSLGDGALGRSSLVDRPAGTATVFGPANAQNPQPCRHEVEHLADRLADDMERAAAAGKSNAADRRAHEPPSDDAEAQLRNAAFLQGLQKLGWTVGRNLRIDFRWGTGGDAGRLREYAAELVALAPEVILAVGVTVVVQLQQTTRTTPMVFVQVSDPVGAGFVANLARPGGNITGFTLFEYGTSAKWLELLKEIAPRVTRAAVLRDPSNPSGTGQFGAIQAVAASFRVDLSPVDMRDVGEIEAAVAAFARGPNGGMIVLPGSLTITHRAQIIALAFPRSTRSATTTPPPAA